MAREEIHLNEPSNSVATSAGVLLNSSLSIIDGVTRSLRGGRGGVSALMAEACAVREACWLASARNLVGLSICSDSKYVLSSASSDPEASWEISAIIEDSCSLAAEFHLVFVSIHGALIVVVARAGPRVK